MITFRRSIRGEPWRSPVDKYNDSQIAALYRTGEAEWIDVNVRITACRDPKDDRFPELAVSGRGTCIESGDSDLLVLSPLQGIPIKIPQALLEK